MTVLAKGAVVARESSASSQTGTGTLVREERVPMQVGRSQEIAVACL